MARLLSINVGLPRDIAWQGRTVHTGIWKAPVEGRRMVRRLNIDGDGQGDLAGHGGEQRAVFVYQTDSYRFWEKELSRTDSSYGQFGENFTVEGLPDDEVCVGDRFRIGGAVFEVTQPRVTCYRVGIRMNEPRMAALLVAHDRPGFYFRVIEEGEVGAGDEIVQVADGPERMTIAEINALLYKPGHPRDQLEQALRIPALSAGWRGSFKALLDRPEGAAATGNPGLGPAAGPPPAWAGFRPLRVTRKDRESASVTSLTLEPTDGSPLAAALPGQFIVLRLKPAPPASVLLRSYSLSDAPNDARYRISIKREPHGAAGAYIETQVRVGDVLDISAPRGSFTLGSGDGPVVLLSAGVGATPVLAMLHALAAGASSREIWWIYGARDGGEHPFAAETRTLLEALPRSRSHVRYSSPGPTRQAGARFRCGRTFGRGRAPRIKRAARCRLLSMRTAPLHERVHLRPPSLGSCRSMHPHRDFRIGSVQDARCGRGSAPAAASAGSGLTVTGRWCRSRAATSVSAGAPRFITSSNSPRRAMSPCDGHAEPESATPARPDLSSAPSATTPSRLNRQPKAPCSSAAASPRAT